MMDQRDHFFHSSVCHTCKKLCNYPAKHCTNCKIVAYCCRDHQLQDWNHHKSFCKVACKAHRQMPNDIKSHADLREHIKKRGIFLQLNLRRKLTKAETQMFMFPRLCAICFKEEGSIFDCPDCRSDFYCSAEHQEQHGALHKLWCEKLKLSLNMELRNFYKKDVSSVKVKDFDSMPASLSGVKSVVDSAAQDTLEMLAFSDSILGGLTILAALEQTGLIKKHKVLKPSLSLHLVGASNYELALNWGIIIEIFFHWLPELTNLNITLIGPDLTDQFEYAKDLLCQNCQAAQKTYDITLSNHYYHSIIDKISSPNLVVAFNSGLHEYSNSNLDRWKHSLSSLVRFNEVPLVLTAYTQGEILKDLEVLKSAEDIEIIYGPCENRFRDVKPLRDWENVCEPIYYVNNVICIIKKQQ